MTPFRITMQYLQTLRSIRGEWCYDGMLELTSPLHVPKLLQHALGSKMPCRTRSRISSGHGIGEAETRENVLRASTEKASSDEVEKCIVCIGI